MSTAARDAGSLFNAVALMGGFDRVVTADPFRGGEVTALMGGGNEALDIRQGAVVGVDAAIIGNIVTVIEAWRRVERQ